MLFSDLKAEEKDAIESFQSKLTKAERTISLNQDIGIVNPKEEPNMQYEVMRRRIKTNVQELWNYISSELTKLQKKANEIMPEFVQPLNQVLRLSLEHKRSLLHDLEVLKEVDGYETWREKESNQLSELMQARFRYLQNPPDCKSAKKLVCNINKVSYFVCGVLFCFLIITNLLLYIQFKKEFLRTHKHR